MDVSSQPTPSSPNSPDSGKKGAKLSKRAAQSAASAAASDAAYAGRPAALSMSGAEMAIALAITLLVLLVFGQASQFGFLSFDDNQYIQEIPAVQAGLAPSSIWWAFTNSHVGQWHPLTSLSFMFDSQVSGLKPGWFHMHNVLLQAAASALLFIALRRLTGATWRSAFAAALFAIHPLRAESVAWVTERKDVLSGLFLMATLWAYAFYVEKPVPPTSNKLSLSTVKFIGRWASLLVLPFVHLGDEKLNVFLNSLPPSSGPTLLILKRCIYVIAVIVWFSYLFATLPFRLRILCILFALGLISKPMLVTVPFVFLLLDYWPLNRLKIEPDPSDPSQNWGTVLNGLIPLVLEKVPLFLLAFASAIGAVYAVGEPFRPIPILDLVPRLMYIPISYCRYVWQFFSPTHLSAHYPFFATGPQASHALVALAVLLVLTAIAWLVRRKQPMFLVGWLWFLGTMLPVIGLVPGGIQIAADRYTYITQIGFAICVSWTLAAIAQKRFAPTGAASEPQPGEAQPAVLQQLCVATAAAIVVLLSITAWKQAQTWKNDESLWAHSLAVTEDNDYANEKYASALQMTGDKTKIETTEKHFREALRLNMHMVGSLNNLSVLLRSKGELEEAAHFQSLAAKEHPRWGLMHRNLASIYAQQRKFPEAIEAFTKAVELSPGDLEACYNLGLLLSETSQDPETLKKAADCFSKTIALQPRFAEGHFSLGNILYRLGKQEEAVDSYKRAIQAEPKHARAYNNLASLLGARGDKTSAINYYQSAISLDPNYLEAYRNLAESLLKNGAVADAVNVWKAGLARGDDLQAMYRLSWILATHPDVNIRRGFEARDLATKGIELTQGKEAAFHDSLGAALALLGKYEEAVVAAKKALEVVPGGEQGPMAQGIKARIEAYTNNTPYRENPPTQ